MVGNLSVETEDRTSETQQEKLTRQEWVSIVKERIGSISFTPEEVREVRSGLDAHTKTISAGGLWLNKVSASSTDKPSSILEAWESWYRDFVTCRIRELMTRYQTHENVIDELRQQVMISSRFNGELELLELTRSELSSILNKYRGLAKEDPLNTARGTGLVQGKKHNVEHQSDELKRLRSLIGHWSVGYQELDLAPELDLITGLNRIANSDIQILNLLIKDLRTANEFYDPIAWKKIWRGVAAQIPLYNAAFNTLVKLGPLEKHLKKIFSALIERGISRQQSWKLTEAYGEVLVEQITKSRLIWFQVWPKLNCHLKPLLYPPRYEENAKRLSKTKPVQAELPKLEETLPAVSTNLGSYLLMKDHIAVVTASSSAYQAHYETVVSQHRSILEELARGLTYALPPSIDLEEVVKFVDMSDKMLDLQVFNPDYHLIKRRALSRINNWTSGKVDFEISQVNYADKISMELSGEMKRDVRVLRALTNPQQPTLRRLDDNPTNRSTTVSSLRSAGRNVLAVIGRALTQLVGSVSTLPRRWSVPIVVLAMGCLILRMPPRMSTNTQSTSSEHMILESGVPSWLMGFATFILMLVAVFIALTDGHINQRILQVRFITDRGQI